MYLLFSNLLSCLDARRAPLTHGDSHHRAGRAGDDIFGDAAQQHVTQSGPAMSGHHDEINALSLSQFYDIAIGSAKLDFLANLREVRTIGKLLAQELVKSDGFFRHEITNGATLDAWRHPVFAHWNH